MWFDFLGCFASRRSQVLCAAAPPPAAGAVEKAFDVYAATKQFRSDTGARFLATFESLRAAETLNDGIPAWLYDQKEALDRMRGSRLNEAAIQSIRLEWARRQCFVSTPRGGVVMRYSPPAQAFEYFCNVTLPAEILDACAMIYCMRFCCRDLCVAEHLRPEGRPSPVPEVDLSQQLEETMNLPELNLYELTKEQRDVKAEMQAKRRLAAEAKLAAGPQRRNARRNRYRRVDSLCHAWSPLPEKKKAAVQLERPLELSSDMLGLFSGCAAVPAREPRPEAPSWVRASSVPAAAVRRKRIDFSEFAERAMMATSNITATAKDSDDTNFMQHDLHILCD